MASITIRKMNDAIKAKLRIRAAHRGRSMEDEARDIIRTALAEEEPAPSNLGKSIHRRFSLLGGVELSIEERQPIKKPLGFEE